MKISIPITSYNYHIIYGDIMACIKTAMVIIIPNIIIIYIQ